MKIRLFAACSVAAAAFACGGGGGVSLSGNIRGSPLPVSDSASGNVNISTGGAASTAGAIIVSTMSNLCSNATANKESKNSRSLILFVADFNSTAQSLTAPTAAGTYTVSSPSSTGNPPPKFALAAYSETDATCKPIDAKKASGASGTITLTTVNNGSYAGSMDIVFDDGDHVTGSFNASNCAGLQTAINSNTTTCN